MIVALSPIHPTTTIHHHELNHHNPVVRSDIPQAAGGEARPKEVRGRGNGHCGGPTPIDSCTRCTVTPPDVNL